MSPTRTRIGLVHAVGPAMRPIHAALDRLWPEAERSNLLDDALPGALERDGGISPRIRARILQLARLAAQDAQGVLFTCSAFAPAIEAAAAVLPLPVLKPDDAMFLEAIASGERIGMIATFAAAVPSMEAAFLARARELGSAARIETVCLPEAMAAARAGDVAGHDRLVAQAAPRLAHCDAILLAHFSTATALQAMRQATRQPVFSAPEAAVRRLRALVEA